MVPKCFGLEVVQDAGYSPLKGFDFKAEWLLEVEQVSRRMTRAGVTEGIYPDVGSLKVCEQICCLFCVYGGEGKGLCDASAL